MYIQKRHQQLQFYVADVTPYLPGNVNTMQESSKATGLILVPQSKTTKPCLHDYLSIMYKCISSLTPTTQIFRATIIWAYTSHKVQEGGGGGGEGTSASIITKLHQNNVKLDEGS